MTEHGLAGAVTVRPAAEAVRACPACLTMATPTDRVSAPLARCRMCGLVHRAFEVGDGQGDYWSGYTDNGAEQRYDDSRRLYYRDLWRAIRSLPGGRAGSAGGRRILDVGCVPGLALSEAARDGWEIDGVEITQALCDATSASCGARMWLGFLEDIDFGDRRYDLVLLSDMLRAAAEPVRLLRKAGSILRPGGAVVIREIDAARAKHHSRIERPYRYDMQLFDRRTAVGALRRAGFSRVRILNSPMSLMTSIRLRRLASRHPGLYAGALRTMNAGFRVLNAVGVASVTPSFLAVGQSWASDGH